MDKKWFVRINRIPDGGCKSCPVLIKKEIQLKPSFFKSRISAINYVNDQLKQAYVNFSIDKRGFIKLTILKNGIRIIFGDSLRDIFGFDRSAYEGISEYYAGEIFSLTRCIDFLYVYSSVGEHVRIGNVKAPLIGVIVLPDGQCDQLTEKVFENPTYVPLIHHKIFQIDIEIRDGNGELVPFLKDAITLTRLHFRRK